jgi:hypothetical protein
MHCAATHDKYFHLNMLGQQPADPALVTAYGGGSTPADQDIPSLASIRQILEKHYRALRDHVATLAPADLELMLTSGRTVGQSIILLAWHEAHHQGQIHLTWNMYKQAHGLA